MEFNLKRKLKLGLSITFFIFILSYGLFQARDLIFGISIKNVNIENQTTFKESPISVSGNAKNAIFIAINGREISVDKVGNFKEDIALSLGYNIVKIEAKDKFGHSDEKNYKLIYQKNI